jgi:hypothetical protein
MDAKFDLPDDPLDDTIKVGDEVQWECNGQQMFADPRHVIAVSDDGEYVYVEGRAMPLPLAEVTAIVPKRTEVVPVPDMTTSTVREDTFTLKEGEVSIRYPASLSTESFDDVTQWLILEHRKIRRFVDTGRKDKSSGRRSD